MALEYYMQIDGVEGESQSQAHLKHIPLLSLTCGSYSKTDPASGQAVGDMIPQVLSVDRSVDSTSIAFGQMAAAGKVMPTVRLFVFQPGLGDILTLVLANAMVETQTMGAHTGGGPVPTEQITMSYSKIQVLYRKTTTTGLVDAGTYTFALR